VRDDRVRVVAEDVFSIRGQGSGAVESCGEVGGEEGPDAEGAEGTTVTGRRKGPRDG
jgi:hypothetical protein